MIVRIIKLCKTLIMLRLREMRNLCTKRINYQLRYYNIYLLYAFKIVTKLLISVILTKELIYFNNVRTSMVIVLECRVAVTRISRTPLTYDVRVYDLNGYLPLTAGKCGDY